MSYVYLDGSVIVRRKKREHLVTMATEMFRKKYELFFLEEIRYFP